MKRAMNGLRCWASSDEAAALILALTLMHALVACGVGP